MLVNICSSRDVPLSPLLKCTMHHLTAHIHSLVSTNIQQALMNVSRYLFFPRGGGEVNDTNLLHLLFHIRGYLVRLPLLLPSVTWQQNVMECWWEGSTSPAIAPTSASDVVGQHKEALHLELSSYRLN